MRLRMMLALTMLALTGCHTHMALRDNTLQTAATLADLNCQQVLDNVARFAAHPAALPSLAVVNTGTVMVTDQSSMGGAATYSPTLSLADQIGGFPICSLFFTPNVTRSLAENWEMKPVTDVEKVRRLRCVFQRVVTGGTGVDSGCDDCEDSLDDLLTDESQPIECAIPTGWFCIGCKSDVPAGACFVGNYHETYVWVMPDGIDGLSQFTITVMQLATRQPVVPTRTVLRKYDREGKLESVEITTNEPDPSEEAKWPPESEPKSDSEPESMRQSLLTTPPGTPRRTALTPKQARKRRGTSGSLFPHMD